MSDGIKSISKLGPKASSPAQMVVLEPVSSNNTAHYKKLSTYLLYLFIILAILFGIWFFWDMFRDLWYHDFSSESKRDKCAKRAANPWYNVKLMDSYPDAYGISANQTLRD